MRYWKIYCRLDKISVRFGAINAQLWQISWIDSIRRHPHPRCLHFSVSWVLQLHPCQPIASSRNCWESLSRCVCWTFSTNHLHLHPMKKLPQHRLSQCRHELSESSSNLEFVLSTMKTATSNQGKHQRTPRCLRLVQQRSHIQKMRTLHRSIHRIFHQFDQEFSHLDEQISS